MPRTVSPKTMARLIAEKKVPKHYAVPRSEGDDAVQAWIALLPDWQRKRAAQIDATVKRQMPEARKAIKWHVAMYGVPGRGWFMAMASFKAHLKLNFFDGEFLMPLPPVNVAAARQRALDIRDGDEFDDARLAGWVKQARMLPGWNSPRRKACRLSCSRTRAWSARRMIFPPSRPIAPGRCSRC